MLRISTLKLLSDYTILLIACALCVALAAGAAVAAVTIADISADSEQVELYDKLEIQFQLNGLSANVNPYWPYDPAPAANTPAHPNAIPAGVGVSADGLFLPPGETNWNNAIVQPAFYYQHYERGDFIRRLELKDWLYPVGDPHWRIRFTPTVQGGWRYRIRVVDAQGSVTSQEGTFTCSPSSRRGFVRVSDPDYRYFETSDGRYLNVMGTSDDCIMTYAMDDLYPEFAENGINLIRPWWQGSQGPILFGVSGQGGIRHTEGIAVSYDATRPGELFSGRLIGNSMVTMPACVKPSKDYVFSAWVKTKGVIGSGDYGVYLEAFECTKENTPLTQKLRGDTDWTHISAKIRTKSYQYSVVHLRLVLAGADEGTVWWTDFSLKEDLGNGKYGPELARVPNLNKHTYISQSEAFIADYQTELSRDLGIYLKVVLEEKADWVYGSIREDGTAGPRDENNFYASNTHAGRTYQKYFWRYIIARYGYATSIHSFELCNEGDPFNGNHTNALEAFSAYFAENDPNKHLCTTSNWHSYPSTEMWQSAPSAGYTDWHQYVGLDRTNSWQYVRTWPAKVLDKMVTDVYRSPPRSLLVTGDGKADYRVFPSPVPVTPGHTYTISWYIKGRNVQPHEVRGTVWSYPTLGIQFKSGWWGNSVAEYILPKEPEGLFGTFDWTRRTATVKVPDNAHYVLLEPQIYWCSGDVWFDDISMRDDTTGIEVGFPNGDFSSGRLDYDTALMHYTVGEQVGLRGSRQVKSPFIRGEVGIRGDNIYGSPYKGYGYVDENQQLVDDEEGIWYKKLTWAHISAFGVIDMYWWKDNIMRKGLLRYVKAYQQFMSGIPLNNGNYDDARAVTSSGNMRAWGQKDLVNNQAHLWIDNAPYNWKNVVDGVRVAPISGTVTLSDLADGDYAVSWWDTSSGVVLRTETVTCTGGKMTLSVQNLVSDTACRIRPVPPDIELRMTAPNIDVAPGEVVTITVHYTNKGHSEARNAEVVAGLPAEMDYVAGSAEASGGTWNPNTKVVTWNIDRVPAGAAGTKTFQARVK